MADLPIKIIECPRDAMQGIDAFIPTEEKVQYLNQLLKVGYDTLDAGSFVSAKVIPQMRDTREVFDLLDMATTTTKILAIAANTRGAEDACRHPAVTYVGFPLSISETFQQRNTNKSIAQALDTVSEIQGLCVSSGRTLVTYLSMAFGNPYKDPYSVDIIGKFIDILVTLEIKIVSLADTIGMASPEQIKQMFTQVSRDFPDLEVGVHLHSQPTLARQKVAAAAEAGCRRFDGALKGFGGCPMANDALVGNMATETIVEYLNERGMNHGLNLTAMAKAEHLASKVFTR